MRPFNFTHAVPAPILPTYSLNQKLTIHFLAMSLMAIFLKTALKKKYLFFISGIDVYCLEPGSKRANTLKNKASKLHFYLFLSCLK